LTQPSSRPVQGEEAQDPQSLLLGRVNELIRMEQISQLGPERVIDFAVQDLVVRLHLPLVHTDFIQKRILATRAFYELPQLLDVMGHLDADSVVVDAGANIGNHSVFFGLVCGVRRVHAFEPMRVAYANLVRNLELNGLANVTAHNKAVGAAEGHAELLRYTAQNTGGTMLDLGRQGRYPVTTVDALGLDRLDLLKIDVEGAQHAVLEGAAATLARCRPLVWLELRPRKDEFDAGNAHMEKLGYRRLRSLGNARTDHLFQPR
jgi:FkbM family methyltransferase